MGDDRKPPPKPEAPTRKARKFELEAVLAKQAQTTESSLYVDDEDDRTEVRSDLRIEEEEERTQIRDPRAGYVSYDEGEASEETGRAYYNLGDDAVDDRATTEPPRLDTQPVPSAAPLDALLVPPAFAAPPRFDVSMPPVIPAIPPGPHGVGAPIHVPPMPPVPLDGDELAAITRDFQRRRRRVFAAVGITLLVVVIAIVVHEPLLEAVRAR